ncbi:MAG TPA: hypothetical protein VJ921_09790 [Vicinamibacteria bacterium]|nr:hypothetical protein [Vicinamibacteria bacterium]
MRVRVVGGSAVALFLLIAFGRAEAYPGFARKYSPDSSSLFTFMPCAGCHDTYPKLTPFGRRFKENGFRMDDDTTTWKDALRAYPIALRTTMYVTGIGPDSDASTSGVIKPILAGGLGSTVSFWFEQPFDVNDDGFSRRDINYAWVGAYDILRGVKPQLLNVRGGSFELDLPFTQIRTHNLFAYDPYFLSGGDPEWSLAEPQRGFEVSGRPVDWGRYSIAISDSVRRSEDYESDYEPDVYARFAADFDVTHRVGVFFYEGGDDLLYPEGTVPVDHTRVGTDFDLRFGSAGTSLYGLYLWGNDRGFYEEEGSNGGFVQAEKTLTYWLLATARYTHLSASEGASRKAQNSLALGAQAWIRERIKFAFEYRFQKGDRPDEGVFSIDFVL